MEGLVTSTFLSLSIIYLMINYVKSELSNGDCLSLGYNRANLACSSCDLLEKFELATLKADCLKCCNSEDTGQDDNPIKKYPKARLEVCGWKLGGFPQVQAFVKSDRPGKFPNLQVKYVGGQMPQIKLIDEDGGVAETLSINKWDTDTIVEFLQTHLEGPSDNSSDSKDDSIETNEI